MNTPSIYEYVKTKLVANGVLRTEDGRLALNDKSLFELFVKLERSKRDASFDGVLNAANAIEEHLVSINKKQLMAFVYMYLRFSNLTPKRTELDEFLTDGSIRKINIFEGAVSDEERLIGLWATVKYNQQGQTFLRVVYATSEPSVS